MQHNDLKFAALLYFQSLNLTVNQGELTCCPQPTTKPKPWAQYFVTRLTAVLLLSLYVLQSAIRNPFRNLVLFFAISLTCLLPLTAQAFPSVAHPSGNSWATKTSDEKYIMISNADNEAAGNIGGCGTFCSQGFSNVSSGCTSGNGISHAQDDGGVISSLTFAAADPGCAGHTWDLMRSSNSDYYAVEVSSTGKVTDIVACLLTYEFDYGTGCAAPAPPAPIGASVGSPLLSLLTLLGFGGLIAWRFRKTKTA